MGLVVFFLASVGSIACAIALITQRNPFISALALLGNLAGLATLYLLLEADFVAAAQVIVYAGAVMVMFLFVIAYVGPRGELGHRRRATWQVVAALVAAGAIFTQIALAVGGAGLEDPQSVADGYGSPAAVGELLLTNYLIAFEVVSLLLLVAAVAGVVLASGPRPHRVVGDDDKETAEDPELARRSRSRALLDEVDSETAAQAGHPEAAS